jgi:uncharacterized protein (DUF1501 family)
MAFSRRSFLLGASGALGATAFAAGLDKFSLLERTAYAAPTGLTGYRALVCVFLLGGNDSNNMVVPIAGTGVINTPTYATYAAIRKDTATLNLTQASLQSLDPTGLPAGAYGLHQNMDKLAGLFNTDKKLAIVSNVGNLVQPTTKAQFLAKSAPLSDHLFSHLDQQLAAAAGVANPTTGSVLTGWGGRSADLVTLNNPASANPAGRYPELTFYGGVNQFGVGAQRKPMTIPQNGSLSLTSAGSGPLDIVRNNALHNMQLLPTGGAIVDAYGDTFDGALAFSAQRSAAITGTPVPTDIVALYFPAAVTGTAIGQQLLQILKEIVAGASTTTVKGKEGLGMKRQLFSAGYGSFDTHIGQLGTQGSLLSQLDDALYAFHKALEEINVRVAAGQISGITAPIEATLFTQSDFTRTFAPNSTAGTDHGWGGHQLVLGSAVVGGAMYGTFPSLVIGAADDVGEGRWLPSTSTEQYANTLARWFGITSTADQNGLFPNLTKFVGKPRYLAFMG